MPPAFPQDLLVGEPGAWLEGLPSYQRDTMALLIDRHGEVEAAVLWLTTTGARDTAPYGGPRAVASNFFGKLLREIQKLICTNEGYEQERAQFGSKGALTHTAVVATIAAAVSPHVGAAAVVIAPVVAVILSMLANAGKATACEQLAGLIADWDANHRPPNTTS